MKILYYDCFSGISGDMNLGALIDLGVPKEYLIDELAKLQVSGYEIKVSKSVKMGIEGTYVKVLLEEEAEHQEHTQQHEHEHSHEHEHHHNRGLIDITELIEASALNQKVKNRSIKMFDMVAEAEGKIHGKDKHEVHFHEVGAVDSIVDIVGAAICLDYLNVDKILSSSVEVGRGMVKCAHGIFPVPAPATTEILKGVPIKSISVPFEATTPTGAVILKAYVDKFTDNKEFIIEKAAYGIGFKDGEIPNVLRVFLGEEKNSNEGDFLSEEGIIIECNIDDMSPELYEPILERLFKLGVMDAYLSPIIMKKTRPAIKLSVLTSKELASKVEELLLFESTTLGVRKYNVEKTMLKREVKIIDTVYGPIAVKLAMNKGKIVKFKAEYEDCKKASDNHNVPLKWVYNEIDRALNI
ncbi:MAG TPA: nickel pincer cofactor biosynthesis protein LarC [Clostridiaceae bacterium]